MLIKHQSQQGQDSGALLLSVASCFRDKHLLLFLLPGIPPIRICLSLAFVSRICGVLTGMIALLAQSSSVFTSLVLEAKDNKHD